MLQESSWKLRDVHCLETKQCDSPETTVLKAELNVTAAVASGAQIITSAQ